MFTNFFSDWVHFFTEMSGSVESPVSPLELKSMTLSDERSLFAFHSRNATPISIKTQMKLNIPARPVTPLSHAGSIEFESFQTLPSSPLDFGNLSPITPASPLSLSLDVQSDEEPFLPWRATVLGNFYWYLTVII